MDQLMAYHEQVFLKIAGKIPPETSIYYQDSTMYYENTLMEHFLDEYSKLRNTDIRLKYENILEIISSMNEYQKAIERGDRLANSYFKYHKKDNALAIQQESLDE